MSELHWTAEETRKGWGIRYNPTPGGVKNANGTTSFSLSFIALELTDMVSEAEDAAKAIARELNSHAGLLEALRKARHYVGMVRSSDIADDDPIFGVMDEVDAAIAKAEGR